MLKFSGSVLCNVLYQYIAALFNLSSFSNKS
nr:MAG TPA: hypothetical protein [Caudoviricetes sp.]